MIKVMLKLVICTVFIMISLHAMQQEVKPTNIVTSKIEQTKSGIVEALTEARAVLHLIKEHPVQTVGLISASVLLLALFWVISQPSPPSCLDCLEAAAFSERGPSSCDFICKIPILGKSHLTGH